jgi:hypothetical protein
MASYQVSTIFASTVATLSGDLVLSPVGPLVDIGSKQLINRGSATSVPFLGTRLSGDSVDRIQVTNDGIVSLSSGSAAADVFVLRGGVNTLRIGRTSGDNDATLECATVSTTNNTNTTLMLSNTSSTNTTAAAFAIESDGQASWGPFSSNGARDVFQYRSAAGTLKIANSSRGTVEGILDVQRVVSSSGGTLIGCASGTSRGSGSESVMLACPANVTLGITSFSANIACGNTGTNNNDGVQYNTMISCDNGSGITNSSQLSVMASTDACRIFSTVTGRAGSIILGSNACDISGASQRCAILRGNTVTLSGCNGVTAIGRSLSISNRTGNVVFSDNAGTNVYGTGIGADHTFEARFQGGVFFRTNAQGTLGVSAGADAQSWSAASDERVKDLIGVASHDDALVALKSMDIYKWRHLDCSPNSPHSVGPTAQQFYSAFGPLLEKSAPVTKFSSAKRMDGSCSSNCRLNDGDDLLLLDERDEKSALWLVIKKLSQKVEELENKLAKQ